MTALLTLRPAADEKITITAATRVSPTTPNGHQTLRVDAVISAGARAGQSVHREYVLDGSSIPARKAIKALMTATGVSLDASGNLVPSTLVGRQVANAPKFGAWLTVPVTDDERVRASLAPNDKGAPRSNGANIELILRESNELKGRIRYNAIANQIEIAEGMFSGLARGLDVALMNWLASNWNVHANSSAVGEQLLYVAQRWGSYDPLREYLDGLVWDGVKRIDDWLTTYCGVAKSDYAATVGAKWLISAVARGLAPGSKVDTMLILQGEQGKKKSTAFDVLGGPWFSDTPLDPRSKDDRIAAASAWINEFAELSALKRSDLESFKAFVSARRDFLRPPYGRKNEWFERRCVFAGTTNEDGFLVDVTGNRRFWIVRVTGEITIDTLKVDRDQLWAEAVTRYRNGEKWWLDEMQQETADDVACEHAVASPWADLVHAYVESQPPDRTYTMHQIAFAALGIGRADLDARKASISTALRAAGLRQDGREDRPGEGRVRVWKRS